MGKGQLTIEFFFVLVLFTIVIYTLNAYVSSTKLSENAVVINQQKTLSNDLVQLANTACNSGVETNIELPCIITSNGSIDYLIYNGGPGKEKTLLVAVKTALGGVTGSEALCDIQINEAIETELNPLSNECEVNKVGKTICIKKNIFNQKTVAELTEGACQA